MGGINKRNGLIMNTTLSEDGSGIVIQADVPLAQVFFTYLKLILPHNILHISYLSINI